MTKFNFYKSVSDKVGDPITLLDFCEYVKSDRYKDKVLQLRAIADEAKRKDKKRWFAGARISGTFDGISDDSLISHSGYIAIDFDDIRGKEVRQKLINDKYTHVLFTSVSGEKYGGFCVIVRIDGNYHRDIFYYLQKYYKDKYGYVIDRSCVNVSRFRFVSYDPDLHYNESSTQVIVTDSNEYNDRKDKITNILNQIIDSGIDLTQEYEDWIKVGFALANDFGEVGRGLFHKLSNRNAKYKYDNCDRKYTNLYKSDKGTCDFRAIINIGKKYGFKYKPVEKTFIDVDNETIIEDFENFTENEIKQTPFLDDDIYKGLPHFIQEIVAPFKERERDVVFLSSLCVMSGLFHNVSGKYHGSSYFPNLMSYIIAPPASGKRVAEYPEMLGYSIESDLKEMYDREMMAYEEDFNAWKRVKNNPDPEPERPKYRTKFLAGDTTSSAMSKALTFNKSMIMLETESDTITRMLESKHGGFTDLIRKAFGHETHRRARSTNDEYEVLEKPCLSCIWTGTPDQPRKLLKTPDNGTFSRFLFYSWNEKSEFTDPFASDRIIDFKEVFKSFSNRAKLYSELSDIELTLSVDQRKRFVDIFKYYLQYYNTAYGVNADGVVKRLGLMVFRICMILERLVIDTDGENGELYEVSDNNFNIAMLIVNTCIKHAFMVMDTLDSSNDKIISKTNKKSELIEALPDEFTTKKAIEIGIKLGMKENAIQVLLTRAKNNKIIKRERRGVYKKVTNLQTYKLTQ